MDDKREIIQPIRIIPEDEIYLVIPGRPQGKGRPRFSRMGNRVVTYTPEKTREYEKKIKKLWKKQSGYKFPEGTPIELNIKAHYPLQKNLSKKAKAELEGKPCLIKGDLDNISKIVQDAGNGVFYHDDAEICKQTAMKDYVYGEGYVEIEVKECKDLNI